VALIKISENHTMEPEEVLDVAKGLAARLEQDHGVIAKWGENSVILSGKGVSGTLNVSSNRLDIEVKLGMAFSLFKGVVEREMRDYLKRHIH
jgi:putative polyhydroxyalkanoate system protein